MPLMVILLMERALVPTLLSVTVWAELVDPTIWLPKVKLVGDRVAPGATPVPLKLTDCGLPEALSVALSVPVRAPVAVGVKVTLMVQLVFTAREAGQLLV